MNAVNTTTPGALDDMALVIRLVLSNGLVTPSDIETASDERINTRYAREILGLLTRDGLFTVEDDEEVGQVWMIDPDRFNADSISDLDPVREAIRILNIDVAAEAHAASATATKTKPAVKSNGLCRCGCGTNVAGKSIYRPGHDARHAGRIAREVAADLQDDTSYDARMALEVLPTPALRTKAWNHAQRLVAKAKPKVEIAFIPDRGEIKIGRWTYTVESTPQGQYIAYKSDGTVKKVLTDAEVDTQVQWEPAK